MLSSVDFELFSVSLMLNLGEKEKMNTATVYPLCLCIDQGSGRVFTFFVVSGL